MRRRLQLLLVLLLIAGTTEAGVQASTDCERWIASYRAELAHAKALRRVQAAQARMKRAAQRKLTKYIRKPSAPKPLRVHLVRPRLTRQQMLDRFNLLCGDLPGGARPAEKLMEGKLTPVEFAAEMPPGGPVEIASTGGEGGLLPIEDLPVYTTTGTNLPTEPTGGGPGGPPIFAGGVPPGGTTPIVPVIPDVPEPGSVVLVLTGVLGAAGVVRRRWRG